MMEVYVVSKEFYNDYEILAVYDSFDKAKLFVECIQKNNGKQPEITMYEINPYMDEINARKHFYRIEENNGEYIVKLSNDFSTPVDYGTKKIYKCWAHNPDDALMMIKNEKK